MENIINPRNNNRLIQKTSNDSKKPELTIKSLGEMLIEYIDRSQEEIIESRLFKPKRQLINYLFNGIGRLTEVQLKDQLSSSPLDKEDNLTLYTFYLSQTEHFNFEWSYLLSKLKNTHDFLQRFNKYINFSYKSSHYSFQNAFNAFNSVLVTFSYIYINTKQYRKQ